MNRIYKVIWSKVKHQYVVVSELAHSCTKSAGSRVGRSAAAVLAALALTTGLCAAPVQAEDLTDPYALLNAQVEETNSTSSDTLVTLVQSPLAKSVAPLANEDEGQPGEGGDTTVTTPTEPTDPATEPTEQHTIVNEDGFYAYNGEKRNTYNSLNKDGLWVGGTDDNTGFHVDNDGNVNTTGDVSIGGDLTVTNKIQGGTFKNANGSFAVDESGNIEGNDMTAKGEVSGATLANTTDTFTVDAEGNVTAADITAADVTASGEVKGATFANTAGTFGVNADGDVTAVDVTATGAVQGGTFKNTNGSFAVDESGNVEGNDMTAKGEVSGATLANTTDTFAVDAEGNVTAADITAADVTASGEVKGATFANTAGTFNVNATGNVIAADFTAGNVKVNGTTNTITGLSNTTWDEDIANAVKANANGEAGYAATQGQLKTVSDKADSATAEAAKHTTLSEKDGNLKITNTAGEGEAANYDISLNEDLSLTSVTAGIATVGNVKVDGTANTITGLSNTTWDKAIAKAVETNANGEAGYAATQGQLKTVYDEAIKNATGTTYTAGNGLNLSADNKFSVKSGNGIAVDGNGVQVHLTADEQNLVLEGDEEGKKTLGLRDIISLTQVTATDGFYVTNGGSFTSAGLTIGDTKLTSTGLTTALVSGLTNTTWEAGTDYSKSDKAATEAQLQSVYNAIDGAQGKEYKPGSGLTLGGAENDTFNVKTGNGIKVDDTNAVTVNQGNGLTFGEIGTDGEKQLQVKADKGIVVSDNGVAVNVLENGNLAFDNTTGALKLADNINITGTLGVSGKATFTAGADMSDQKITSVGEGTVDGNSTDAVNGSQLYKVQQSIKTYTDGDGITIDTADGNKISVNAGKGLTFDADDENSLKVAIGEGLGFDPSNQVKVNVGNGLTIDTTDGANDVAVKISGDNLIFDAQNDNALSLSTTLKGLESLSSKEVIVGADVGVVGIKITGEKITGLLTENIKQDTDAVNKEYVDAYFDPDKKGLAVQYDDEAKTKVTLEGTDGTEIKGLADAAWEANSDSAASVGLVYDKVGEVKWTKANYLDNTMDLTEATKALDSAIGTNRYTGENVLDKNTDGKTYASITDTIQRIDNVIGPMQFKATNFLKNQTTLSGGIDKLDSSLSDALGAIGVQTTPVENEDGTVDNVVSTRIDWKEFNYITSGTIVDGMRVLDGHISDLNTRVTTLEGLHPGQITTSNGALSTLSNMDMKAAAALSSLSADDLAAIATLSENGTRLPPQGTDDPDTGGDVGDPSTGGDTGNSNPYKGLTTTADKITTDRAFGVTGDLDVTGNTTLGGTLTVTGESTFNDKATFNKDVDIKGTLNMNNNTITGVKAGEISATSTEAINGSQLYETNQKVAENAQNIGILGSAVNKLGDRIERVGAGAAALAALHPLDFDPDNKLDFAAGFGNYRGASAVAVGAFYRPSENVMFSVGGAFGGGEDMVNAGVSFKVGAGSGSATTSRTAMAKSLKSMQEVVASQDAQLAQQREQIDKLTAMVELLMEQNGQAQPKDGDAQAAQPQQ